MNRAAANIIVCLVALNFVLIGCSADDDSRATPQLQIIGEISTNTPTSPAPLVTLTPSPTPLPSRTPLPTARQVIVSRVNENINPALVTPIAEGAKLPDLTVTDINGNEIHLAEIDQPLILNFWSVGCGSCFFEFPLLQDFYEHHRMDNLAIIGVNIAKLSIL